MRRKPMQANNEIEPGNVYTCKPSSNLPEVRRIVVYVNTSRDTVYYVCGYDKTNLKSKSLEEFMGVIDTFMYELEEDREDISNDLQRKAISENRTSKGSSGSRQMVGQQFHNRSTETAMNGKGPRAW